MRRAASWWIAVAGALSAVVIAVTWRRAEYGLDRTDEGFYLLHLREPWSDPATTFLTGYLLHPVYDLFGGDIVQLRRFGIVVSCVLAAVLVAVVSCRAAAGMQEHRASGWRSVLRGCLVGGAASGAGALVVTLLPMTPSYNTVAFWGGLLTLTGLALALPPGRFGIERQLPKGRLHERPVHERRPHEGRLSDGWLLVGFGGGLTFVGKPTSAATLAVIASVAVLVAGRERGRAVLAALLGVLASAAVLLTASGASPVVLARTVREGVRSAQLLAGHEQLIRLDALMPTSAVQALVGRANPVSLQVCLLLAVAALVVFVPRVRQLGRSQSVLALCLLLAPAAVVFGTNVNYWTSMGRLAVLWVAALLAVVPARRSAQALALAGAMGVVALVVLTADGYAYRYPPRGPQAVAAIATSEGARVLLSPQDAAATEGMLAQGARHGLAGAPMLDTTGASPGYVHTFGAHPLGSAWLLGGYPGSAAAARHALSLERCESLQRARILYAPQGPRRITSIWDDMGVQPSDYERLFTFHHILGYDVQVLAPAEVVPKGMPCRARAP